MWNDISLTESEERVLGALRFIDPEVERIAPVVVPSYYYGYAARGGFKVKLKGTAFPVPIGSLGDGIWRMLAMAISLIRAKGGVLLIDEIDTGLHYTVMADMWKLLYATAKDSNVQVFATTHSYDCIYSLATICDADVDANSRVTIQRIESGKGKAVPYTESEIKEAAKRHIEVR
jgi:AAA15 family ATPase/GTPase